MTVGYYPKYIKYSRSRPPRNQITQFLKCDTELNRILNRGTTVHPRGRPSSAVLMPLRLRHLQAPYAGTALLCCEMQGLLSQLLGRWGSQSALLLSWLAWSQLICPQLVSRDSLLPPSDPPSLYLPSYQLSFILQIYVGKLVYKKSPESDSFLVHNHSQENGINIKYN